jgi:hypothetical protein
MDSRRCTSQPYVTSEPAVLPPTRVSPRTVVALIALALGGFAIGTTEFVTMGVLPEIADGVGALLAVAALVPLAASALLRGRASRREPVPTAGDELYARAG